MPFGPLPARFDFNRGVDATVAYDLNWLLNGMGGGSGGSGMMPYLIPVGETFTVPINKQGLFALTIDVQGTLVVDGLVIQVD